MSRVHASLTWRGFGVIACAVGLAGCFDGKALTRGLPCTSDAACDGATCSYGVCGGPTRCASGASVGEYCFAIEATPIRVGDGPTAITIGDVNHDLRRDIVSVDRGSRSLSIRIGHADGTFEAPAFDRVELGFVPTAVGIGSLDSNGWADLAVTAEDGSVHVVLLDENGATSTVAVAEPVAGARAPVISDFVDDESGLADVAVLGDDGIRVAKRSGDVAFDPTWIETHISDPTDILTVRDAAGVPTVAYVALASNDEVSTFGRDAQGKFSASAGIGVGPDPQRFVLVDINGDAYGDIISANARGQLWRTLGKTAMPVGGDAAADPGDRWSRPEQIYELGWIPSSLVADNLDDDADAELVIAGTAPDGRQDVYLFDNDGDGNLIYGGSLGLRDAASVALSDVDRDTVPELLIATSEGDAVRLARRTVAPPPVDGTGSATDTGKPSTDGFGSEGVGPGTGGETGGGTSVPVDTGVDTSPPCDYSTVIGMAAYTDCDQLGIAGTIAGMAFTDYTDDGLTDLVVLSQTSVMTVLAAQIIGDKFDYVLWTEEALGGAARIWASSYPLGWGGTLLYTDGAYLRGIIKAGGTETRFTVEADGSLLPGVGGVVDVLPAGDGSLGTRLAILTSGGIYVAPSFEPLTEAQDVLVDATLLSWPNAFVPAGLAVPSYLGEFAVEGSLVLSNPDLGEVVRLNPTSEVDWQPSKLIDGLTQPTAVHAGWTGDLSDIPFVVAIGSDGGTTVVDTDGMTRLTIPGVNPAVALTGNFDGAFGTDLLILDANTRAVGIVADVLGEAPTFVYVDGYSEVLDLHAQQIDEVAAEIWLALPDRIARLQNY